MQHYPMPSLQQLFDLSGNVALVTGAGTGLGALFSDALAEAGADVACTGLGLEGLERTGEAVRKRGRRALVHEIDVTDEAAVRHLIDETVIQLGRIDILVNNAGIAVAGPPEDLSISDWKKVVDVNLTGVFICAQAAAGAMIAARRGGRIVNVASILGAGASEPAPAPAYAATKGAVVNLTRDLAVHWAPHGIRVNALGPAYFPSEMTSEIFKVPGILQAIEQRTPMGRVGRLEELKGPVVFLASDASSYVTGQTLFVDGGWTAR